MIGKILYINLDRRPDRNEWFLENMETAGVPIDKVERFRAHDWQDYGSLDSLMEAIHADGVLGDCDYTGHREKHAPPWALLWSQACCLQKFLDSDWRTVLIMLDDSCLNVSWAALNAKLSSLSDVNPLWLVQLGWGYYDSDYRPFVPFKGDRRWIHGIHSVSEQGIVYTRYGAMLMLGMIQGWKEGMHAIERIVYDHFNNFASFHYNEPLNSPRGLINLENFDSDIIV